MLIRPLWVLLCGFFAASAPLGHLDAQEASQAEILPPGVDRVLYVPLSPEEAELNPRLQRQEADIISRYMRDSGLSEVVSLAPVKNPALYRAVEGGLVMESRAALCANAGGDSLFNKLDLAKKAMSGGDLKKAGVLLKSVREALPCAPRKMSRTQIGEIFLLTGLVFLDAGQNEEGETWIRSGLSVDEDLKSSPLIPERFIPEMEPLAFAATSGEMVDARLSPEQGELWDPRNLVIDGRRMLFDRVFLELVPGYHYVQLSLPDGTSWGAILTLDAGQIYDVIEGVRGTLNVRAIYADQAKKAVDTGEASDALSQGLRYYTKSLRREEVYLARVFPKGGAEADLMIRRFHVERGFEMPEEILAEASDPSTGWVPVQFAPPWAVDLAFGFSQIQTSDLDYRSTGLGLELNARYLLARQFYLGGSLGGGVRFSQEIEDGPTDIMAANPDLAGSIYGGIDIPLGAASIRGDLGYLRQLYALDNIGYGCQLSDTSLSGQLIYTCSEDLALGAEDDEVGSQSPIPFAFKSAPGGPRFRLTLVFTPFKSEGVQLQGLLRAGYTPLLLNLPNEGKGAVGGQDVIYQFKDGSNSQILHRIDVNFGLSGAF